MLLVWVKLEGQSGFRQKNKLSFWSFSSPLGPIPVCSVILAPFCPFWPLAGLITLLLTFVWPLGPFTGSSGPVLPILGLSWSFQSLFWGVLVRFCPFAFFRVVSVHVKSLRPVVVPVQVFCGDFGYFAPVLPQNRQKWGKWFGAGPHKTLKQSQSGTDCGSFLGWPGHDLYHSPKQMCSAKADAILSQ